MDKVSFAVAGPLEDTAIEVGLRVICGPRGERVAVRETVPENPFKLVKLIVTFPDDPRAMDREEGLSVIVKSGITTVTVTVTECVPDDAVPVTVTE